MGDETANAEQFGGYSSRLAQTETGLAVALRAYIGERVTDDHAPVDELAEEAQRAVIRLLAGQYGFEEII